jgi:hypothetical protein
VRPLFAAQQFAEDDCVNRRLRIYKALKMKAVLPHRLFEVHTNVQVGGAVYDWVSIKIARSSFSVTCLSPFDFGDSWDHVIKLEKWFDNTTTEGLPLLLEAARRCPPEDLGGAPASIPSRLREGDGRSRSGCRGHVETGRGAQAAGGVERTLRPALGVAVRSGVRAKIEIVGEYARRSESLRRRPLRRSTSKMPEKPLRDFEREQKRREAERRRQEATRESDRQRREKAAAKGASGAGKGRAGTCEKG